MQAEQLLREGKADECLAELLKEVRGNPADAKLRVFLFQLLSIQGEWDRALTQLNVAADLDANNLLMAQVCRQALQCEALREEVFAGNRSPLIFGEPQEWVGWMAQANQMAAQRKYLAARKLRDQAFEAAPAAAGSVNGRPFEWNADADTRLGPILETIIDGRYFWTPFHAIREIVIEEPANLRDIVWIPAQFTWANGGTCPGLIPTRYAGSHKSDDASVRMARKTDWMEHEGGHCEGLGQRLLATDNTEYPLLEIRRVVIGDAGAEPTGGNSS